MDAMRVGLDAGVHGSRAACVRDAPELCLLRGTAKGVWALQRRTLNFDEGRALPVDSSTDTRCAPGIGDLYRAERDVPRSAGSRHQNLGSVMGMDWLKTERPRSCDMGRTRV